MPITSANVAFRKSTHTVSATDCLGGPSGSILVSQEVAQPSVVTGCYISQAFSNPLGQGTLTYSPVTQMLGWKPPASTITYFSVPVTANGNYTVGTVETGAIVVNVTFASLPTGYRSEALLVSSPIGTVFGQVTALMALVGDVQYRCTYFQNNHPTLTANDVRLYIHAAPAAPQVLAIGLDPAGAGNGSTTGVAQTIANESTAPTGVTFSSPLLAASGIPVGTLGPGQSIAFWQRRTVPPMAYGGMEITSTVIGVALVG